MEERQIILPPEIPPAASQPQNSSPHRGRRYPSPAARLLTRCSHSRPGRPRARLFCSCRAAAALRDAGSAVRERGEMTLCRQVAESLFLFLGRKSKNRAQLAWAFISPPPSPLPKVANFAKSSLRSRPRLLSPRWTLTGRRWLLIQFLSWRDGGQGRRGARGRNSSL